MSDLQVHLARTRLNDRHELKVTKQLQKMKHDEPRSISTKKKNKQLDSFIDDGDFDLLEDSEIHEYDTPVLI